MKLLANENIPAETVDALRDAGHDVLWIRMACPGADDETVLARAVADDRLLITFDKDFGELVYRRGRRASTGVVLFRIGMPSPEAVRRRVVQVIGSREDWTGHFAVVEPDRIRIVDLPDAGP